MMHYDHILTQGDGTFAVNPVSGVITLARSLDFDTANTLTISIRAEVSLVQQAKVPSLALSSG